MGGVPRALRLTEGAPTGFSLRAHSRPLVATVGLSFPAHVRRPRPRGAPERAGSLALTRPLFLTQVLGTQPCSPSLRPETGHESGRGPRGLCGAALQGRVDPQGQVPPTHRGHWGPRCTPHHFTNLTHLSASQSPIYPDGLVPEDDLNSNEFLTSPLECLVIHIRDIRAQATSVQWRRKRTVGLGKRN